MNNKIDLTINTASIEEIRNSFARIAQELINDYYIELYDVQYQIIDVEFYYYNFGIHQDCNIHFNEKQTKSNKWYIHKKSLSTTYKRKGIDLTFGEEGTNNSDIYGGILIKKVKKMNKPEKVLSQSLFIDDLLKVTNFNDKENSHFNDFKTIIDNNLELNRKNKNTSYTIQTKPRVGLTKPCYKESEYSFFIDIQDN